MTQEPLPPPPTADEFKAWIKTADALRQSLDFYGKDAGAAVAAILNRIELGRVVAVAETVHWRDGMEKIERDLRQVPGELLAKRASLPYERNFWRNGDIELETARSSGRSTGTKFSYCGVRFDPVGFGEFILASTPTPILAPDLTIEAPPSVEPEPQPPKDRKPVPEAWLQDWYTAYRKNLPSSVDTETNAWRSADAFFPAHGVARQRIRDLRKGTKTGPKARDD